MAAEKAVETNQEEDWAELYRLEQQMEKEMLPRQAEGLSRAATMELLIE